MDKVNCTNLTGSPAVLKQINRVRILNILRMSGPASRASLARDAGLDAKTITNVCNSLFKDNLIVCADAVAAGRGRPAAKLSINSGAAFTIGIDIGAVQVTGLIIDLQGKIRAKWRQEYETAKTKKFLLTKVNLAIEQLLGQVSSSKRKKIAGIGVCIPGFIDRTKKIALRSVNIKGMKDVPVGDILNSQFGLPVALEESSRAMALGEVWFGDDRGGRDFLCIDMGYGIGMGIIQDGLLYRGANETSGEIGHTIVQPGGELCQCGKHGCLETVGSGRALSKHSAKGRNAESEKMLADAGHYIGIAIANAVNLFDPRVVILNGGLVNAGSVLLEPLKEAVKTNSVSFCPVKISTLGENAGALGAAMVPLKKYFEFENIRFRK